MAPAADVTATATHVAPGIDPDSTPPTLAISGMPATVSDRTPITLTFTWSEPVTGFAAADIAVVGGVLSGLSGSGDTYTATLTPAAGRNVALVVSANSVTDASGNDGPRLGVAANATYVNPDMIRPALAISGMPATVSDRTPISLTFTWSEPVTGFTVADITTTGGALSAFTGSGDAYTATLTPAAAQSPSVTVAADTAADNAGNTGPTADVTVSATYVVPDTTPPTVAVTGMPATWSTRTPIPLTFTWSEDVTGFSAADIQLASVTIGTITGSGKVYRAAITPTATAVTTSATIGVRVRARSAADVAGNLGPTAAVPATANYIAPDITPPTVAVSGAPAGYSDRTPFTLTFTWSESVTGFTVSDIRGSGADISAFSGSGDTYTAVATPTSAALGRQDPVYVIVLANGASDAAGNTGPAANVVTTVPHVVPDTTKPSVVIGGMPATVSDRTPIPLTFTWSEAVVGFITSDATVTGGVLSTIAGSGTLYAATLTPAAAQSSERHRQSRYRCRRRGEHGPHCGCDRQRHLCCTGYDPADRDHYRYADDHIRDEPDAGSADVHLVRSRNGLYGFGYHHDRRRSECVQRLG